MKKILLLVTAAFLISGTMFSQDSTKTKAKKINAHQGKTCEKPAKKNKA